MDSLAQWVRDAEKSRRLFERLASGGVIGTDSRDAACQKALGFGVRTGQNRVAVADLLDRLGLAPQDLPGVDASKVRAFVRKGLPEDRKKAVNVLKNLAGRRSAEIDDKQRRTSTAKLRGHLAVVVKGRGHTYQVTFATQRRKGQLHVFGPETTRSLPVLAALVRGAAWQSGSVVLAMPGLTVGPRQKLLGLLGADRDRIHPLFGRALQRNLGDPARVAETLTPDAHPRARRLGRRPTATDLLRFICDLQGWRLPSEDETGLVSTAVTLLVLAERRLLRRST